VFSVNIPQPVTKEMLADLGYAIYGPSKHKSIAYQKPLAELFGVSTRQIRRMLLGEAPIQPIRMRQFWRIHDALAKAAER